MKADDILEGGNFRGLGLGVALQERFQGRAKWNVENEIIYCY